MDIHFKLVADAILRGKVVPFLGAGVNLCDRPAGVPWNSADLTYFPSGSELAEELAREFHYQNSLNCEHPECPISTRVLDLPHVAQHCVTLLDEGPVYAKLRSIFAKDSTPTTVHRFLASLTSPRSEKVLPEDHNLLIVSTNYDDLMEKALVEAGKNYDVVFYIPSTDRGPYEQRWGRFWHKTSDRVLQPIISANEYSYPFCHDFPTVLKIHGTIERDNPQNEGFVVTEDQYIEYMAEEPLEKLLPSTLLAKLCDHHLLFLGYSLRDWNSRVFLRRLKSKSPYRFRTWAVLLSADEAERQFWLKNGVEIVTMELNTYIKELNRELASRLPSPMTEDRHEG